MKENAILSDRNIRCGIEIRCQLSLNIDKLLTLLVD